MKENKWVAVWISAAVTVLFYILQEVTTIADWIFQKPLNWLIRTKTGLTNEGVAIPETAAWLMIITSIIFPLFFVYYHWSVLVEFCKHLVNFRHKLKGEGNE